VSFLLVSTLRTPVPSTASLGYAHAGTRPPPERPRVTDVVAVGLAENEVLRLAGSAEARSGHPLADAELDQIARRGLANDLPISDFENIPGHGVRATVGGRVILVGAERLWARFAVPPGDLAQASEQLLDEGKTLIFVAADGRAAGLLAAADIVRPTAARAIAELKALGIEPVMMTGDNRRTADGVARQVGIERVFAEVLPEDKAEGVRRLQAGGEPHSLRWWAMG
jgi:P-type E1-E2 ATPase